MILNKRQTVPTNHIYYDLIISLKQDRVELAKGISDKILISDEAKLNTKELLTTHIVILIRLLEHSIIYQTTIRLDISLTSSFAFYTFEYATYLKTFDLLTEHFSEQNYKGKELLLEYITILKNNFNEINHE